MKPRKKINENIRNANLNNINNMIKEKDIEKNLKYEISQEINKNVKKGK